jgi:hypothetical protein
MSTLRTSITLASDTLFPTPVNFTKTVNESVDGYNNGFQQVTIAESSTVTIYNIEFAAGNAGVVYFYAESLAANTTNINFGISHDNDSSKFFARLIPGDVLYLPLWALDTDGITVFATNEAGAPATVSFFIGEKE